MNAVRRIAAVGIAVASDMLGVTLSGLIYTPVVYGVMHALTGRRQARARTNALENH